MHTCTHRWRGWGSYTPRLIGCVVLEIQTIWVTSTLLPFFLKCNGWLVKFQIKQYKHPLIYTMIMSLANSVLILCQSIRCCEPTGKAGRVHESCVGRGQCSWHRTVMHIMRCLTSLVPPRPIKSGTSHSLWELKMLSQMPRMLSSHNSLKGIQE